MTTVDLTYLLVIGIPLLIILCVIMFMIGRRSGKKQVYHMMNGGQLYHPESPAEAAARIVDEENRRNWDRQIARSSVSYAPYIRGMDVPTDPARIPASKGWFSWLTTEGN